MLVILWSAISIIFTRSSLASEQHSSINIIYPKEGQVVGAIDSTFIFGNISPISYGENWHLQVNGQQATVHPCGGFLAFVPVSPGEFEFNVTAQSEVPGNSYQSRQKQGIKFDTIPTEISTTVTVKIPSPSVSFPIDSLRIGDERRTFNGDLIISTGDRLTVSFQATPGCRAWFSIPNVIDSVPMVEIEPQFQAYWGESVFGVGAVPDSLKIKGVYSGFYDIPESVYTDSIHLEYHLAPPMKDSILVRYILSTSAQRDSIDLRYLSLSDTVIIDSSSYTVEINSADYPKTVRFTDSVQIIRHGPHMGYLTIFQPKGVEALAVGKIGKWYRLQLSANKYGWAHCESVELLSRGHLPPQSYVVSLRTYSYPDRLIVKIPLSGKHPFKIVESNRRTIYLRLFGVTSNTDWIRYDTDDELIDMIKWSQPEQGIYELTLQLNQDIWGCDSYYEGNTFCFQLNRPPERVSHLRGKTIVIDPGHSKDPGAIGPTGYTEADANLAIALVLKKLLKKNEVEVIMTRSDTSHVPLYDRPAIAKAHNADLFISIHNNALPDGVNPFVNNGSSTFYYHPHSLNLARAVHAELVKATELEDHGLYYGNLAVLRPTQYPAILVECAFMIIPEQEAKLKTSRFRYQIAKGLYEGIENFFKGYDRER